jgi:tRNA(adenine34) deaminase
MQVAATFSSLTDAMETAIDLARVGAAAGELGIGAVVVNADLGFVAARHDEVRSSRDPLRHAAVLALRDAASVLKSWRLGGCYLVVTREPCSLCAGAALSSRLQSVVIAALDDQAGCIGSRYNFGADPRLNHEFEVTVGVLADAATEVYVASRLSGISG